MDLIEIDVVDMAAALLLTLGITQAVKMTLDRLVHGLSHKFAPLIAIVAAALSVAVLIDRDATGQEFWLAVIVVTLTTVGGYSSVKNMYEGVQKMAHRQ